MNTGQLNDLLNEFPALSMEADLIQQISDSIPSHDFLKSSFATEPHKLQWNRISEATLNSLPDGPDGISTSDKLFC